MERNPPPSHTVRPVLRASLPALATSGRYHRRRRHQVRPLPEASLTKAKQKAQRMSSQGESDPDSAPSQSPLPPHLSTSQGGHRALPRPACPSTSHRLRQTQGPQDPASAPRLCLAPLPPLPTAQQDGLLSGFPHQTNPSPASRPLPRTPLVPLPKTPFPQLFTYLDIFSSGLTSGSSCSWASQPTPCPEGSGSHLTRCSLP